MGRQMQEKYEKLQFSTNILLFSKMIQDKAIVTMEYE